MTQDDRATFGHLFPLLAAYPSARAVAVSLSPDHRWHRDPMRLLRESGIESAGDDTYIRRVSEHDGWTFGNVAEACGPPRELLPYLQIERRLWLEQHAVGATDGA